MFLRKYQSTDCEPMLRLFYDTVHTVNAKDYSKAQLDAWATGQIDFSAWNQSFLSHYTIVAVEENTIVGYGDIDETGYLDRLYVHKDCQRQGIGTAWWLPMEEMYSDNNRPTETALSEMKSRLLAELDKLL